MRPERFLVALVGFALVFPCAAPTRAAPADTVALIRIDAVTFKENGRLDPKVVAECDLNGALRAELEYVQRARKFRVPEAQSHLVTLRVDKIGTLGSSGRAGTELGVMVIPKGQESGPLLLCQAGIKPFRFSHCERITACVRKISKDILTWARQQSPP